VRPELYVKLSSKKQFKPAICQYLHHANLTSIFAKCKCEVIFIVFHWCGMGCQNLIFSHIFQLSRKIYLTLSKLIWILLWSRGTPGNSCAWIYPSRCTQSQKNSLRRHWAWVSHHTRDYPWGNSHIKRTGVLQELLTGTKILFCGHGLNYLRS